MAVFYIFLLYTTYLLIFDIPHSDNTVFSTFALTETDY